MTGKITLKGKELFYQLEDWEYFPSLNWGENSVSYDERWKLRKDLQVTLSKLCRYAKSYFHAGEQACSNADNYEYWNERVEKLQAIILKILNDELFPYMPNVIVDWGGLNVTLNSADGLRYITDFKVGE